MSNPLLRLILLNFLVVVLSMPVLQAQYSDRVNFTHIRIKVSDTPTATSTFVPSTPTPPPSTRVTLTPTPTSIQIPLKYSPPTLLRPIEGEFIDTEESDSCFEWRWEGALDANEGFELLIWKEGENHFGAHDARNQEAIRRVDSETYRLCLNMYGVFSVIHNRYGEYLWSVAIVQLEPYQRIIEAKPKHINLHGSLFTSGHSIPDGSRPTPDGGEGNGDGGNNPPPAVGDGNSPAGSSSSGGSSTIKPVEMIVFNIKSQVQANGTVKYTAQLSLDPLEYGDLQLTTPLKINLGESRIVRLVISPDSALSDLPRVPILSSDAPDYSFEYNNRIKIYPVMIAELSGINFRVNPNGPLERTVTSILPVEWLWSVTPTEAGKQSLLLNISIPIVIDQTTKEISVQPLQNIPIQVFVEVTATPTLTPPPTLTPTPTPMPTPTHTLIPLPTSTPTPVPFIDRPGGTATIGAIATIIVALIPVLATYVFAKDSFPIIGTKAGYQRTLRTFYTNLGQLEAQAARHGMDVPLSIQNEIEFTKEKIAECEGKLADLESRKQRK